MGLISAVEAKEAYSGNLKVFGVRSKKYAYLGVCLKSPLVFIISCLPFVFIPAVADAFPFFSRQVGRDCTYCHSLIPKLNETGRVYKSNGYRFEGEGEWKDVKDWTTIPASFEVEVEGAYSSLKKQGVRKDSSDLKIEEAEIAAGGAIGKAGKVSSLLMIGVDQTDTGTDTKVRKAFVQVNDLLGATGAGILNARAGQWDLGLHFLNPLGSPITNRYLAESNLGIFTLEQRAVELNGSVAGEGDTSLLTHRYALGLAREDVNGDDKLKGYYAVYSATFNEIVSLGAIYRGGHEKNGPMDVSFDKYGAAAEAEAGPVILTLGYFKADRYELPSRRDYLAEVVYKPFAKLSFGARYDHLKERLRKGVKSQSIMARYSILSNVYTQVEYRGLSDDEHITSASEKEDKIRVFLVAVY